MNKTAIVIGATGLVGRELVDLLLKDNQFSLVKVFTRKSTGLLDEKLKEIIIDFDRLNEFADEFTGDVLFSSMGTTIKKAKTKANQYKVDFTYQYESAKICANKSVPSYVLISSGGANSKSKIFYSRIKGELEVAVEKLGFKSINILQPSVLVGNRNEFRLGEKIGIYLGYFFTLLPGLRKFRPVQAKTVAKAMINCYNMQKGFTRIAYSELHKLAK